MAYVVAPAQVQVAPIERPDFIIASGRLAYRQADVLQDAQIQRGDMHIGARGQGRRHQVSPERARFADMRQASGLQRDAQRHPGSGLGVGAGEFSVLHEGVEHAGTGEGGEIAGIDEAQPVPDLVQED